VQTSDRDYENNCWTWINEIFPGRWKSYREFCNYQTSLSRLTSTALWEDYSSYCQSHVVFSTPTMSASTIALLNAAICRSFLKEGRGSNPEMWQDIARDPAVPVSIAALRPLSFCLLLSCVALRCLCVCFYPVL
jgi:hypothetical protein